MKSPILLIAFNRLDTVQKVFCSIREARPEKLFVFADGPRASREGEAEKCREVRSWLQSSVDWPCELRCNFPEQNYGCGKGPSAAISWFFEYVDEGIILEDDCVPHPDFYEYALQMIDRYRDCPQVMAINSSNFQPEKRGDGSYYFSMQNGPFCAWATWKRAWTHFDYTLNSYSRRTIAKSLSYYGVLKREREWWLKIYDSLMSPSNDGSSWDYQYIFAIWASRGKSIVPNSNLSTNIGFGPGATHTTNPDAVTANRPMSGILPLTIPSSDMICREADLYYHDFYYDRFVDHTPWYIRLKRKIKKLIKYNA